MKTNHPAQWGVVLALLSTPVASQGPPTCNMSDDCRKEGEYCSSTGFCLQSGDCRRADDCTAFGNDIFLPDCLGTVTCELGQCGKTCYEMEDGDGVSCTSDTDCDGENEYCAQGLCTQQGGCFSDEDCINPSNARWGDKYCLGYLHCSGEGLCDRVCGVDCKNGSTSVECLVNPCDVEDWTKVDEAVSCSMTTCDGECKTVLFDAAGEVLSKDISTADDEAIEPEDIKSGAKLRGDKIEAPIKTMSGLDSPKLDPNPTLNLESSAIRVTSILAIIAAVLVAAIV